MTAKVATTHRRAHGAGGCGNTCVPAAGRRLARGFTLIEVLLATTLLAAGLALAFSTLRAATAISNRGEAIAQRNERMRAVEGFLRTRLAATQAIAYGLDRDSGLATRFKGDDTHMHFVADLPDYLGRGGPYLHELAVERDGDGVRLTLALHMVLGGQVIEESPPRPPELLADDLRAVRFRYRALDATNKLADWRDHWDTGEALPLQVEITLRDRAGRDWPPLLVALPLAGSYAASASGPPIQ